MVSDCSKVCVPFGVGTAAIAPSRKDKVDVLLRSDMIRPLPLAARACALVDAHPHRERGSRVRAAEKELYFTSACSVGCASKSDQRWFVSQQGQATERRTLLSSVLYSSTVARTYSTLPIEDRTFPLHFSGSKQIRKITDSALREPLSAAPTERGTHTYSLYTPGRSHNEAAAVVNMCRSPTHVSRVGSDFEDKPRVRRRWNSVPDCTAAPENSA